LFKKKSIFVLPFFFKENVETSIDLSKSDETLQLSEKKDAIQIEDITRETGKNIENTLGKYN